MLPMTTKKLLASSGWSVSDETKLPDSSFAFVATDGTRHLPYRDSNGSAYLPLVRNALAALDTNAAIPADKRGDIRSTLQNSLRNTQADASTDVGFTSVNVIKADDSGALPTKIMLLRAGTFHTEKYGEVPLSVSDLQEMKANYDKGIGMAGSGETGIPIDYSHESHKNAGGWIKGLTVEGDALFGTPVEYSGSGRKALEDKEYKMLSSDFYPGSFGEWVDAESGIRAKNVIVGAAFTNRPMFTGNQPVIASSTDNSGGATTKTVIYINASQTKETSMDINALRVKAADDVSGPEQRFLQAHAAELSAEERTKFEIAEPVKADDKKPVEVKATEIKGDEGTVIVQAAELKGVLDEVATLKASYLNSDKEKVHEEVKKHAAHGHIKADRIDSWTNRIVASEGTAREELLADLAAIPDNPVLAATQGSADGEEGNTGVDARGALVNKALELQAAARKEGKTLSIEAAMDEARAADKDLAVRAAAQGREKLSNMQATDAQFAAAGINRG